MAWGDLGTQRQNFYLSKVAEVEARKYRVFSALANKDVQPKYRGDELVKYVEYPIIHEANINDKGIDANGAKLLKNVWYAYDAAGNPVTTGADAADGIGFTTKQGALAAAGANGTILSGSGNIYGGDTDFAVLKGSVFPALRETGGLVNRVGYTRKEVSAKVTEYGLYMDFTQKELDMTDEPKLLTKYSKALGEAIAELRERQVEVGLLDHALATNVFFSGDATAISNIGIGDEVSLKSIRRMQEYMKKARVPAQTKIVDGSQKTDTVTVGKGYFAYYPQGLLPTLEEVTDSAGVKVWVPVEKYANGAGYIHPLETGKISNTRFIEVPQMAYFAAAGERVDLALAGTPDPGSENYQSSVAADGLTRYDIYPILYVGTDAFASLAFQGDNTQVKHALPGQPIPGVDAYGKNGLVSASFYSGLLVYRPERIAVLLTPALNA